MGKSLKAFFRDWLAPKRVPKPTQDTINGYRADYTPLATEEIAAPAACDEAFKTGKWVPVNRKA